MENGPTCMSTSMPAGTSCFGKGAWVVSSPRTNGCARAEREQLIAEEGSSAEVIKPLLAGADVRRYELHARDTSLLYLPHGIDIDRYPAIRRYLARFRRQLEQRATRQKWYELQQPQA